MIYFLSKFYVIPIVYKNITNVSLSFCHCRPLQFFQRSPEKEKILSIMVLSFRGFLWMRSPPKRLGTCRRGAVSFLPFYITNIEYHTQLHLSLHPSLSLSLPLWGYSASLRLPTVSISFRSHSTSTNIKVKEFVSSLTHS